MFMRLSPRAPQTYPAPHALVAMAAAQLLESTRMQRRLLCFHILISLGNDIQSHQ